MKFTTKHILSAILVAGGMSLSSCDSMIYDEADDCVQGVAVRFVYDYHMEKGANAFPANVDCINLFIFDSNGKYLGHQYETSERLRDDHYVMEVPLTSGKYHLVAYGGLACENPAFDVNFNRLNPDINSKDDILVSLPLDSKNQSANLLHDIDKRTGGLFYGTLDVTVTDRDIQTEYRVETLYMMKDTNNIQVIMQELGAPYEVDYNDYDFTITDDNFKLDGYNNKVSVVSKADGTAINPEYKPYNHENRVIGYVDYQERHGALNSEDETRPVQVACVEFSTSRLFHQHLESAKLIIKKKKTDATDEDKTLIEIPLITYLEQVRGFGQNWIKDDQEYLDRESRWTLMFFLQNGRWVNARVSVNAWTVRLNQADF